MARRHQRIFDQGTAAGLFDAVDRGGLDAAELGKCTIVPSHQGSALWYYDTEYIQVNTHLRPFVFSPSHQGQFNVELETASMDGLEFVCTIN